MGSEFMQDINFSQLISPVTPPTSWLGPTAGAVGGAALTGGIGYAISRSNAQDKAKEAEDKITAKEAAKHTKDDERTTNSAQSRPKLSAQRVFGQRDMGLTQGNDGSTQKSLILSSTDRSRSFGTAQRSP